MADVTAERRLVKSPPELWTELSEVESLARHLGELGEIRITKVEPESTVAWEGEQISGTVRLEQSGWGTKVTLSATVPEPDQIAPPVEPEPTPEPISPPEPEPVEPEPIEPPPEQPDPEPTGFWARLLRRRRRVAAPAEPEPVAAAEPEPEVEAAVVEPETEAESERELVAERVREILDGTLDALGQAHHRPFSRG